MEFESYRTIGGCVSEKGENRRMLDPAKGENGICIYDQRPHAAFMACIRRRGFVAGGKLRYCP